MNNNEDIKQEQEEGIQTTQIKTQKKPRGFQKKTTTQQDLEILRMSMAKVSQTNIAKTFNLNERTVYRRLQNTHKWLNSLEEVNDYEQVRTKLLANAESKLLENAMCQEKLNEAKLSDVVNSLDKIHKMNRLERNLTTDNQAIKVQMIDITD